MRRVLGMFLAAPLLLVTLVATASVPFAPAASARCAPPDGNEVIWKITKVRKSYKSTGVSSNWVHPKYDKFHINYSESDTSTTSATVTATISAEAGVIFAKASTSLSVAVGKQWSKTKTWSYTADVPKDPDHQYRLVQKQETRKFLATKYAWSFATCKYSNKVKSGRVEMPRLSEKSLVWRLERRSA